MFNKKQALKFTLPVVERRSFPGKDIFIVNFRDKQYPVNLLRFQQSEPTPATLQCIVENPDSSSPTIKQDLEPILQRLYHEGKEYDFVVEADWTRTVKPRYQVRDDTGLWFYIYPAEGQRFVKGEKIRCRVVRLRGTNINLEVVYRYDVRKVSVFEPDNLPTDEVGPLLDYLRSLPGYEAVNEMLAESDYQWIFALIRMAWDAISELRPSRLLDVEARKEENAQRMSLIDRFITLLTYFLEDSGYLNEFAEEDANTHRTTLTAIINSATDLRRAWDIVSRGEEHRYIDDIFGKMRSSGYLIHPERRLRTMMYVFMLGGAELMNTKIPDLFDVLLNSGDRRDNWHAEPFRSALVEQIQLYIDANKSVLDTTANIDASGLRDTWERMVRALALQQFLANDSDSVSHNINRSRLLRYLTFQSPTNRELLLDKSLKALLSAGLDRPDYQWDDISDTHLLWHRLLSATSGECISKAFETSLGVLKVSPYRITFNMPDTDEESHPALPPSLNLHNDININLDAPLPSDLRSPVTIPDYKKTWAEIMRSIFEDHPSPVKREHPQQPTRFASRLPDVGDEVEIIVEGIDPTSPDKFHCTIVEEGLKGSGTLPMKEIININWRFDPRIFRNYSGAPYIIVAKVTAVDGVNDLKFSLLDGLGRCVRDNFEVDDILDCVVTAPPRGERRLGTAFCDNGFAVWLDQGDFTAIKDKDYIQAIITDISSDGKNIKARCIAIDGEKKDYYAQGSRRLIEAYSQERVMEIKSDDSNEEAHEVEDTMSEAEAMQVMHLIARRGSIENDLPKSYSYYATAEIIARLLQLPEMERHYHTRRHIIELLDDFATNGRVDPEQLEEFTHSITTGAVISPEAQKVRVLAMLDHPEYNDELMRRANGGENTDTLISDLSRMVLIYNMLDGLKMPDARSGIRDRIYQALNLKADLKPVQIAQGRESNTVEFKTSIVFPAGRSHRADIATQTAEIAQVICGMLNAQGGKLYVGVSDEGYIRGVESDLEVLGNADKFNLTVHNAIRKSCGFLVNESDYIDTSWETYGNKSIYVVDIKPYPRPVAINGIYYQRQGTSTLYVPDHKVEEFVKARTQAPADQVIAGEVTRDSTAASHSEEPDDNRGGAIADDLHSGSDVERIATTTLRRNVLHDYEEGYTPVHTYLYFMPDKSLIASFRDLYREDDAMLTLALSEKEMDEDIIMVYQNGFAVRIAARSIVDDIDNGAGTLRKNDPVMFAAPAQPDTALIIYYRDRGGNIIKQAFKATAIERGSLSDLGARLVSNKEYTLLRCELIPDSRISGFNNIFRNGQKIGKDLDSLEADFNTQTLRRLTDN